MKSFRVFRPLVLLTLLTQPAAGAITRVVEPEYPVLLESPPPSDSCQPPIGVVSGLQVDSNGASFTMSNTSSTMAHDTLALDVVVNGVRRYLWVPVDLKPGASYTVSLGFLVDVHDPIVGLCGNNPVGISESSDPIATVSVLPPATL